MAHIINESGGDYQEGGCLCSVGYYIYGASKPVMLSGHQPQRSWTSDRPQKADQSTFGNGVVVLINLSMELSIGDRNHSL